MATEILKFVEKNWGKEIRCNHCNDQISSYCGSCQSAFYCGASCQRNHWIGMHQYECIAGKKRGELSDEEEEEEKAKPSAPKKYVIRDEEPELTEVRWEDLYGDLWRKIASFLQAEDIQNLSLVQKELQRHIRSLFLARFRFIVTSEMVNTDQHFRKIIKEIQNVQVRNVKVLNKLVEKGAPIVDVKFRDGFDDPEFNIKHLPQIQHLIFGEDFSTKLDVNNLPENLLTLDLSRSYWNNEVNNLPMSLKVLRLGKYFNYPLQNLPKELEHLEVGLNFDSEVQSLPQTLQKLVLWCPFRLFSGRSPDGLKHLKIMYADIAFPLNDLPRSLESLQIESISFNNPVDFVYLTNLRRLSIRNSRFNQPVDGKLPESLRELELGDGFKQTVDGLPSNLSKLILGNGFRKSIDNLPKTLTYLKVPYAVKIPAWITQKKNRDQMELIREK